MRVRCAASVTVTSFSFLAWAASWETTTLTANNRIVAVTSSPSERANRYGRVRKLCHIAAAPRANHAGCPAAQCGDRHDEDKCQVRGRHVRTDRDQG